MKRPLKYCNYCKLEKDVNCFSPKMWQLERGSRICCSCVRDRKQRSRNPNAGRDYWSRTMPSVMR